MTTIPFPSLQSAFRDVMAGVCTPVSVITALDGGQPHATTVSAFASLSLDPPMVVVCLDQGSDLLQVVRRSGRFGVNVLHHEQSELALGFARKGAAKPTGVDWTIEGGVPRLPDTGGFLACTATDLVAGGDHVLVLGAVQLAVSTQAPPLTYHARGFGTHIPLPRPRS